MRWVYARVGVPMWEWSAAPAEQAVMFYDAEGPASSPPPMTDNDCRRLAEHLRKPHPFDLRSNDH